MQLGGTTIRVACNQASRADFVNALGGQAPVIPRAGSVLIPCAVFLDDPSEEGNLLTDLGNLVTANCVIRAGSAAGAVLFEQVIPAGRFQPRADLRAVDRGHGGAFHVRADADGHQPGGRAALHRRRRDHEQRGRHPLVYCATARLKDFGIFNAGAPTAPDYTSWSKAEADARYAPAGSVGLAANVTSVGDGAAAFAGKTRHGDAGAAGVAHRAPRGHGGTPGLGAARRHRRQRLHSTSRPD